MTHILVLGAGVMGSALTIPLADEGHDVHLVGTDHDRVVIDAVKRDRWHPGLNAKLASTIQPYHDHELTKAMAFKLELVVIGTSSAGVDYAIEHLRPFDIDCPVIMLTKGLDATADTINIYPKRVTEALHVPVGAIGGPCIAGELAARRHTSVMLSFTDQLLADVHASMLSAPYYHVRPTTDLVGLELCAALKNFFALGIGAAQGWLDAQPAAANDAKAHNLAAGLFSQAVRELQILTQHFGGEDAAVYGLPGVGDLFVTVQGGRNARMGRLLGAGWRYQAAKVERMSHDTIEGAELALHAGPALRAMMASDPKLETQLPLTQAILHAIIEDGPFTMDWRRYHLD